MRKDPRAERERANRLALVERYLDATSPPNQAPARDFVQLKHAQGAALQTRVLYSHALEKFDAALNGKQWADCTEADATSFLRGLRSQALSPHTVRTTATYAKAFLAWHLNLEKLPLRMRLAFQTKVRTEPNPDRLVAADDFVRFLAALETLMDQALAAVVWETGFRISEALALNLGSARFDD